MKVDHIGYLTSDINKSIPVFQQLGYTLETDIYTDNVPDGSNAARNVYLCFLRNETTRVELVSPIDDKSDVASTIKRQGEGPYHICYRVNDLDENIAEMKSSGWMLLKRPAKAMAFKNARVAFLFKKGAGMIELVETGGENR